MHTLKIVLKSQKIKIINGQINWNKTVIYEL